MIRGEVSILINRPVDEVFGFVAKVENNPRWRPAVKEASQTSQGPMGMSTTYREVSQFLGRRRETMGEIIQYEPNAKIAAKVTGTPIGEIEYVTTFEAVDGGTRMVLSGQTEPDGFFRLLQPFIRWATIKQLNADNARLKRLLEAG